MISTAVSVSPFHHIIINSALKSCNSQNGSHLGLQSFLTTTRGSMMSWLLKLKCVIFKCEWFDPVENRGVRFNKFGVVDFNSGRRYNKFEPFILASQAEQVSFLPYPSLRSSGINWLATIKITPRG
ncbi:hypothetical protein Bca4012_042843 [Brassica carinata]